MVDTVAAEGAEMSAIFEWRDLIQEPVSGL